MFSLRKTREFLKQSVFKAKYKTLYRRDWDQAQIRTAQTKIKCLKVRSFYNRNLRLRVVVSSLRTRLSVALTRRGVGEGARHVGSRASSATDDVCLLIVGILYCFGRGRNDLGLQHDLSVASRRPGHGDDGGGRPSHRCLERPSTRFGNVVELSWSRQSINDISVSPHTTQT